MQGGVSPFRRVLLDRLIEPGMRVLDVGCGDGRHLEYLARTLSPESLFGVEVSQVRVGRVRELGFRCEKVDGPVFPFAAASFDAALLFEVIEHVPPGEAPALLTEIARVLRPGGTLIGSTPNYPIKRAYDVLGRLLRIPPLVWSRLRPGRHQKSSTVHDAAGLVAVGMFGRLRRFLADDPTHQFRCNFEIIGTLGRECFARTELFSATGGRLSSVDGSPLARRLSHKIAFVFVKHDREPARVRAESSGPGCQDAGSARALATGA
jgi:SAM-dependent methyltransferase